MEIEIDKLGKRDKKEHDKHYVLLVSVAACYCCCSCCFQLTFVVHCAAALWNLSRIVAIIAADSA